LGHWGALAKEIEMMLKKHWITGLGKHSKCGESLCSRFSRGNLCTRFLGALDLFLDQALQPKLYQLDQWAIILFT